MLYKSQNFEYEHGKGGCWITDNGEVIHVPFSCGHIDILQSMPSADFPKCYSDAYAKGWIRVTLAGIETAGVTLTKSAAIPALRKARSLLSDLLKIRDDAVLEYPDDDWRFVRGRTDILRDLLSLTMSKIRPAG